MYYNEYKEPALMPEKNCIFNFYIIFLNPLHVHVSSVPQSVPKVDFDLQYNYAYVSSAFVRITDALLLSPVKKDSSRTHS